MTISFRFIAKIGLLLVVIGFFMPIACDRNGFEVAQSMMKSDKTTVYGLLTYLSVLSAAFGVGIGVFLLMRMKRKISPSIDWVVILVCIASGLIVYFGQFSDTVKMLGKFNRVMESGAYMIIAGWIVALAGQLLSSAKREK